MKVHSANSSAREKMELAIVSIEKYALRSIVKQAVAEGIEEAFSEVRDAFGNLDEAQTKLLDFLDERKK